MKKPWYQIKKARMICQNVAMLELYDGTLINLWISASGCNQKFAKKRTLEISIDGEFDEIMIKKGIK